VRQESDLHRLSVLVSQELNRMQRTKSRALGLKL